MKIYRKSLLFCLLVTSLLFACQTQAADLTPEAETATQSLPSIITETPKPSSTPKPTTEPSKTAQPSPQPTQEEPAATAKPQSLGFDYPESHYILGISGHKQAYPLSCEASAASDWANFFGLSIYESSIQFALPSSDNPDYGFVGQVLTDVWGQIPPYAYGVHAGPIADVLTEKGLPAKAVVNYSLEEVKQKLSEDKPIIVWVIGNMEYSEPSEFIDSLGRSVTVAPYEHVVILTGYSESHIRYMNNGKFYDTPNEVFLMSWGVLGNMAVISD